MEKLQNFLRERYLLLIGLLILVVGVGGYFLWPKITSFFSSNRGISAQQVNKVDQPTIVDGELVLPKLYSESLIKSQDNIGVNSAFLVGVFEEQEQQQQQNPFGMGQQQQEPPKLVGIRILGEMTNLSKNIIKEVSPVIRFYDEKNKLISQKLAKITPGFDFFSFSPSEKTVYDVIVEDPPKADKIEILFNQAASEKTASYEKLKISTSSMEIKTAKYQPQTSNSEPTSNEDNESSESGAATPSASLSLTPTSTPTATSRASGQEEKVEYYTLSGKFENNLTSDVSDVTVYAWVKNAEGKVFSFARQDFKNDLISPKKKIDFKINLLPFKLDEKFESYGLIVWAKRYKLN